DHRRNEELAGGLRNGKEVSPETFRPLANQAASSGPSSAAAEFCDGKTLPVRADIHCGEDEHACSRGTR
ncbi:MAG TPA: hypothetical protein VFD30_23075, partial [Terriglobia bacterium]|nr:hypothetical protein [Terriglobia bacterium]